MKRVGLGEVTHLPTGLLASNMAYRPSHSFLDSPGMAPRNPQDEADELLAGLLCAVHNRPHLLLKPLLKRTPSLSPWKAEAGWLLVQGQSGLHSKTLSQRNKQQNSNKTPKDPQYHLIVSFELLQSCQKVLFCPWNTFKTGFLCV